MPHHQTAMIVVGQALILALAHVLGYLARRYGQPAVLGEILAGTLLGPTLFHAPSRTWSSRRLRAARPRRDGAVLRRNVPY